MWLIRYHVIPKFDSPHFQKSGGAYVNCWIFYAWQDGAECLAKFEVEKEWTIIETEEIEWVELDDFEENEDSEKEYFLQAQTDGGCFVYHHYPLDAVEEDEDFELKNSTSNNPKLSKTEH